MKKVIVIDNYDSFTYNLVHLLEELLEHRVTVMRNDALEWVKLEESEYIVLSPGPGIPDEAGALKESIRRFAGRKKILGVCLGHQAIGEVFGAKLHNLSAVYHGVQTKIHCTKNRGRLLSGLDESFEGGRYHSWIVKRKTLPKDFEVTCVDDQGEIMGFQHAAKHLYGLQFHPESVLTPDGKKILDNFLKISNS